MDTVWTALVALAAAVVGGWVGSATQFSAQRRLRGLDLVWEFRLRLRKTQEEGIYGTKDWQRFQEHIHWIRVAASDPRVNLNKKVVEGFIVGVQEARAEYRGSAEASGTENAFLSDKTFNVVELMAKTLDDLAVERLKKLA